MNLWNINKDIPMRTFKDGVTDVMCARVCPTNTNLFVSGGCQNNAHLFDTRVPGVSGIHRYEGHAADINAVAWTNDGMMFATGSDDASCRTWDIRSARQMNCYSDVRI